MQILTTAAAIDAVTDPPLLSILDRYRELTDLATIFIVQPGDTCSQLVASWATPIINRPCVTRISQLTR